MHFRNRGLVFHSDKIEYNFKISDHYQLICIDQNCNKISAPLHSIKTVSGWQMGTLHWKEWEDIVP